MPPVFILSHQEPKNMVYSSRLIKCQLIMYLSSFSLGPTHQEENEILPLLINYFGANSSKKVFRHLSSTTLEQTHGIRKMCRHLSSRSLKASSVSCLFTLTLLGMRERRVKVFGNNEKKNIVNCWQDATDQRKQSL